MIRAALLMLAGILASLGAPVLAKDTYVYGPRPDWAEYRKLGEAAIRARLPDPDGWAIEWPNGYFPGGWSHGGKADGYMTCGVARAVRPDENGRYPTNPFVVVIDRGEVKKIDYAPKPHNSIVNVVCAEIVKRGTLPPASLMTSAAPAPASNEPAALPIGRLGLAIRPMADGAYVSEVTAGTPAAAAGLVPGTVITRVNGIALAGLGQAMATVLAAGTTDLTIELATGAHLTVRRP